MIRYGGSVKRVGATVARFVGLSVLAYSTWVLFAIVTNLLAGVDYDVSAVGLAAMAAAGLVGSSVYLLSFDGPRSWRTRWHRAIGLILMWIGALLPGQLVVLMAPLAAVGTIGLFLSPLPSGLRRGRHLAR